MHSKTFNIVVGVVIALAIAMFAGLYLLGLSSDKNDDYFNEGYGDEYGLYEDEYGEYVDDEYFDDDQYAIYDEDYEYFEDELWFGPEGEQYFFDGEELSDYDLQEIADIYFNGEVAGEDYMIGDFNAEDLDILYEDATIIDLQAQ